jgi:hypothetical protein
VLSPGDEKRLRLSIELENARKDCLLAEKKTLRVKFSTSTINNRVNLQCILDNANIKVCLIWIDTVSTGKLLYDWTNQRGHKVARENDGMPFVLQKVNERFETLLQEKSFYVMDVHGQTTFFDIMIGSAHLTGSPDVVVVPRSCEGSPSENIQCLKELKLNIVDKDLIQAIAQLIGAKYQHLDAPAGLFSVLTDYKTWYFFDFGNESTIRQYGPYGDQEGANMFALRLSALPGFPEGLEAEGPLATWEPPEEPPENGDAGDEGNIDGVQKQPNPHPDAEAEGANETHDEHIDASGDVGRELPSKPSHKSAKRAIIDDFDDLDALCVDNSRIHMSFFVGA